VRRRHVDGAEFQIERGRRAAGERVQRKAATGNMARWDSVGIVSGIDGVASSTVRMMLMGRWQRLMVVVRRH
jgi:hypothetical protein